MLANAEQLLESAARARRAARGFSNPKDMRELLDYAEECEIAAALEPLGQLHFEDVPAAPTFSSTQRPRLAPHRLALVSCRDDIDSQSQSDRGL